MDMFTVCHGLCLAAVDVGHERVALLADVLFRRRSPDSNLFVRSFAPARPQRAGCAVLDTRRSAFGAAVMFAGLFVWMLAYCIGRDSLYGEELFHKLDASRLNLD